MLSPEPISLSTLLEMYNYVPIRPCPVCFGTGCATMQIFHVLMVTNAMPCLHCHGTGAVRQVINLN